jgi:hypothetical protein
MNAAVMMPFLHHPAIPVIPILSTQGAEKIMKSRPLVREVHANAPFPLVFHPGIANRLWAHPYPFPKSHAV